MWTTYLFVTRGVRVPAPDTQTTAVSSLSVRPCRRCGLLFHSVRVGSRRLESFANNDERRKRTTATMHDDNDANDTNEANNDNDANEDTKTTKRANVDDDDEANEANARNFTTGLRIGTRYPSALAATR